MSEIIIQTGSENIKDVSTEAELDALLNGAQDVELDDQGNPIDKTQTPPTKPAGQKDDDDSDDDDDDGDLLNIGGKKKTEKPQPAGAKPDGKKTDDKADNPDEQYDNVIHYLDKKHELGLNLQEIPADMTREDEAELVSQLFEKVVTNANAKLRQYEELEALLEDDEVAALLKAKSEGKGLKDLFTNFSATPEGQTDEQIVFNDLKKKYPKLPEATLNNMIATQKEKGQFTEIATAIREQLKEDETKSAAQRAKEEENTRKAQQEAYQQEVQQFTGLVQKVQKINGVTFTDDMKSEVLNFALRRDNEGVTELDKALQSDVGILRASLGIMLLERLMGAQASVLKNAGKKTVFEKLFTKPGDAGSGGSARRPTEEIPDDMYNKF